VLAEQGPVVMEGRDIGTVVFPAAAVKIYLDASAEERARRRAHDPAHTAAQTQDLADIAEAMQRRDENDRTRQASPLSLGHDATVDTTAIQVAGGGAGPRASAPGFLTGAAYAYTQLACGHTRGRNILQPAGAEPKVGKSRSAGGRATHGERRQR
jgi:hypothetical protein